ncbi:hypothetical protein ACQP3D_25875, partial [Escherichia coli]
MGRSLERERREERNPLDRCSSHKVLVLTDSTRKTRNVKYACSSLQWKDLYHFSPGKLGMDVINNLVIFAICRVGPYPNPSDYCVYPTLL